ncbi:transposase, partial [Barnesiella viscericola]|uniref:transposase n=1 Tax=Barnesiella viscericola TaxID=397865 RepID=UPI0024B66F2F
MLLFYDWNNKEYGMKVYKSFDEMRESLKDESDFREYLEQARWRGTPICPHCGCISTEHYKLKTKGEFKGLYKCKHCRERFTVTTKTMFDRTHIPLRKWFE